MHLLVIEDERALCETIVRSLRRLAYSVDCCYDGEKALELIAVEKYDLILLDLNLPEKDGMTVLRTLRPVSYTHLPRRCGAKVPGPHSVCFFQQYLSGGHSRRDIQGKCPAFSVQLPEHSRGQHGGCRRFRERSVHDPGSGHRRCHGQQHGTGQRGC